VLAAWIRRTGRSAMSLAAIVIMLNALLFFEPFSKLAKASSYRAVAAVDRMNSNALQAIDTLRRGHPLTIVHYGSSVASRHLEYYFPDDYIVVLPGNPAHPTPDDPIRMFYHHAEMGPLQPASGRMPHGSRRLVCLLPFQAKPSDLPGWKAFGPVYYLDRTSDAPLKIGPYILYPDAQ